MRSKPWDGTRLQRPRKGREQDGASGRVFIAVEESTEESNRMEYTTASYADKQDARQSGHSSYVSRRLPGTRLSSFAWSFSISANVGACVRASANVPSCTPLHYCFGTLASQMSATAGAMSSSACH